MSKEKSRDYLDDFVRNLGLSTGDVVIFDRKCKDMSLWGGSICQCAKLFGGTRWDHNAVVIEDEKNELFLLEATLSGVKMRPLVERLRRSNSYEIVVRKLQIQRTPDFHRQALEFSRKMLNKPYEDSMIKLFNAGVSVPTRSERENLHKFILQTEKDIESIHHDSKERRMTHLETSSLMHELEELQNKRDVLQQFLDKTERSLFENEQDTTKVFCSDLVAGLYQYLGLLSNYPPSNSYIPKHFASGHDLYFQKDVTLLPEISILQNPPFLHEVEQETSPQTREEQSIILRCLRRQSLFSETPENVLNELITQFKRKTFQNGEVIFYQNDPGDYFYVIESGMCDVYISDGRSPSMLVATNGRGNGFGDSSLMYNTPRRATLRARSTSTEPVQLWRLDKKSFQEFVSSHPSIQQSLSDKKFILQVISKHPFFHHLDGRVHVNAVKAFFPLRLPAGTDVIRQGDFGDNFYILESGKCAIVRSKPGSEARIEHIILPEQSFGEAALVYNSTRGATVRVTEDAKLWCMTRSTFRNVTRSGSSTLHRLFRKMSSVFHEGEAFMTREDLEKFLPSCSTSSLNNAWRMINPIESQYLNFSQFAHFHMLMASENVDHILPQLAFRLLSPSSSLTGMMTREDLTTGLQKWMESSNKVDAELWTQECGLYYDQLFGKNGERSMDFKRFVELLSTKVSKCPPLQEYINELRKDLHILSSMWMSCELRVAAQNPSLFQAKSLPPSLDARKRPFSTATSSLPPSLTIQWLSATILSGVIARTFVAPLERLKVLMQTQSMTSMRYKGVFSGLKTVVNENGLRGLFIGNGVHVLKFIPSVPLQLLLCDQYKYSMERLCIKYEFRIPPEVRNLIAGGLAGLTCLMCTYPLDFVRGRLSVQTQGGVPPVYTGALDCLRKVTRDEGIRTLYRGIQPSALGAFPYIGLSFSIYECLRPSMVAYKTDTTELGHPSVIGQMVCGVVAASLSQTLTYPFDVVRRRMQVQGNWQFQSPRPVYKGAWDCFNSGLATHGFRYLYQGLVPNLLKVVPITTVSFVTYEKLCTMPLLDRRNQ